MKERGVLIGAARGIKNAFRIVTHHWVTREKAGTIVAVLKELFC
jgi:hypothetical protein